MGKALIIKGANFEAVSVGRVDFGQMPFNENLIHHYPLIGNGNDIVGTANLQVNTGSLNIDRNGLATSTQNQQIIANFSDANENGMTLVMKILPYVFKSGSEFSGRLIYGFLYQSEKNPLSYGEVAEYNLSLAGSPVLVDSQGNSISDENDALATNVAYAVNVKIGKLLLNNWNIIMVSRSKTKYTYCVNGAIGEIRNISFAANLPKLNSLCLGLGWATNVNQNRRKDVRVYNKALNTQEMEELYQALSL